MFDTESSGVIGVGVGVGAAVGAWGRATAAPPRGVVVIKLAAAAAGALLLPWLETSSPRGESASVMHALIAIRSTSLRNTSCSEYVIVK
jgi:hypothetical protein